MIGYEKENKQGLSTFGWIFPVGYWFFYYYAPI